MRQFDPEWLAAKGFQGVNVVCHGFKNLACFSKGFRSSFYVRIELGSRHCEERSDETILRPHLFLEIIPAAAFMRIVASLTLAMTPKLL